ncbi:MAG: protein kinase, partial [Planctomycetota bacterium]|nr:protein kinase [Planctomycetota bacterium]
MAPNTSFADSPIQDSLFGTLAVRYHFVLEEQVEEALLIQRELHQTGQPVPRLGEILTQRGYITEAQVQAVVKGQVASAPKRFGEIAVAMHFCQPADVEAALSVQQQIKACGSYQRLGEILVARGALRPHQVHAVLRDQGKAIVACPNCNTRLNVSGVAPGATASCPRCKSAFRTPSVSVGAQAAPAAADENVRVDMSAVMPPVGQAPPSRSISRLMNAVVGPYQLGAKLGSDSSGVLYKATDPRTGSAVALRILDPSMTSDPEDAEHWLSAGEAASELVHPNLQRILDINVDADRIYLAMEYVEGESLRQSLTKRGKYPVLEAMDVLIQVAEALAYGHAQGFRHGDLRPAHVLIGFDGIVRLSGLGTPKHVSLNLRQVAQQLGEEALPLYTPPEVMIDEENADERSDIYSLGGVAYQMLTGRPPHEGTNVLQVGLKIASEAPRPPRELEPGIPPYVSRMVEKCLRPEPDDRYDSVGPLLEDLRQARQAAFSGVADVPAIAPAPPPTGVRRGQVVLPARAAEAAAPAGSMAQRLREKAAAAAARKGRLRTHVARGARGAARHGA